jgi:hypothetical protein
MKFGLKTILVYLKGTTFVYVLILLEFIVIFIFNKYVLTLKIVLYVTNCARHVTTFPQTFHSLIAITVGMYKTWSTLKYSTMGISIVNEDNEEVSIEYILNVS